MSNVIYLYPDAMPSGHNKQYSGDTTYYSKDIVDELVKALRFYAEGSWADGYPGGVLYVPDPEDPSCVWQDTGEIAKKALAKLEEVLK